MPVQYLPVSWTEYHSLSQSLAAKILSSDKKPDQIVAIARGGLTLGHLLSDLLHIPVSTITIQSYSNIQIQGELKITEKLNTPIKDKQVLLVDDVSDSGKTMKRAMSYLQLFHPKWIISSALYYKPHSQFKPEFFAQTTSKWILFPYEPTEMIILITKQLEKNNKTNHQIQQFLSTLGYTSTQRQFVNKFYR